MFNRFIFEFHPPGINLGYFQGKVDDAFLREMQRCHDSAAELSTHRGADEFREIFFRMIGNLCASYSLTYPKADWGDVPCQPHTLKEPVKATTRRSKS